MVASFARRILYGCRSSCVLCLKFLRTRVEEPRRESCTTSTAQSHQKDTRIMYSVLSRTSCRGFDVTWDLDWEPEINNGAVTIAHRTAVHACNKDARRRRPSTLVVRLSVVCMSDLSVVLDLPTLGVFLSRLVNHIFSRNGVDVNHWSLELGTCSRSPGEWVVIGNQQDES